MNDHIAPDTTPILVGPGWEELTSKIVLPKTGLLSVSEITEAQARRARRVRQARRARRARLARREIFISLSVAMRIMMTGALGVLLAAIFIMAGQEDRSPVELKVVPPPIRTATPETLITRTPRARTPRVRTSPAPVERSPGGRTQPAEG